MEELSRTKRIAAKRRRRRRIWGWVLLGVMLLAVVGLGVAYWELQPARHFQEVPVLAQPTPPSAAQGQSQGQGQGAKSDSTGSVLGTSSPSAPQGQTSTSADSPSQTQSQTTSFNVLILGIDARDGEEDARSDVIMVAHVRPADQTVNLVSIPRDTRVNLKGIGLTKINHAHFVGNLSGGNHGGTEAAVQAVSDFLQIPIHYYAKMNFAGFQQFVDTVGGVDVTFPQDVGSFTAGAHHLNGEQTLLAVRERYSLPNGDFGRQFDQSLVVRALLLQLLRPGNIPHLPEQIKQLKSDVLDTNLTDSDLLSLALLYKGLGNSQIHYEQIPGHSGTAQDPLVGTELYYWIPDEAAVQKISKEDLQE